MDPGLALNVRTYNGGVGYLSCHGPVRAGLVLDSLHAQRTIEPTIAILVNAGHLIGSEPSRTPAYDAASMQRSLEYDALILDFGRFLLDDVLPFVATTQGVSITDGPTRRNLCGMSRDGRAATVFGDWPLANQSMAKAFQYAG